MSENEKEITIFRVGADRVVSLPEKSPEARDRMRHKKVVRHGFMDPRPAMKNRKPRHGGQYS